MKLHVKFKCELTIIGLEKNYSGKITLSVRKKKKVFYFLVLNPYTVTTAEFAIYQDEGLTNPLIEGVGEAFIGINAKTGLPIISYDFPLEYNNPNIGPAYVLIDIISKEIDYCGVLYQERIINLGRPITYDSTWEKNFEDENIHIIKSFQRHFNIR